MTGYDEMAVQGAGLEETTNQFFYANNKLPPEILTSIFRHFEYKIQLLLSCRLVCKHWKSVVDTPELIRHLTFHIRREDDWYLFKESTIVSKVQSLRISHPIPSTEEFEDIFEFADQIDESLEKIVFDFSGVIIGAFYFDYYELVCDAAKLIIYLVNASQKLKELHILKASVVSMLAEKWLLEDLTLHENLKKLVLVVESVKSESVKEIIFRFPKLTSIHLTKYRNALVEDIKIYSALYEYATLINDGSLKVITMNWQCKQNTHEWFKFLFTVLNRGIVLKTDVIHLIDGAQRFLTYKGTEEAPVNETTCQEFISCYLVLNEFPVPTGCIGYCKNLKSLTIDFARVTATTNELAFLQKLQKLEQLTLGTTVVHLLPLTNLHLIFCPRNVLEYGYPLLQRLSLQGDLFGSLLDADEVFSSFYLYFSNIKYLNLYDIQIVPENLFVYLSKLELLEEMRFCNCELTDGMFTKANENTGFLPAINAFKLLRTLEIKDCTELTDDSVTNGIVLSGTLVTVTIYNFYQQFTAFGRQAFIHAGFKYYQLTKCVHFTRFGSSCAVQSDELPAAAVKLDKKEKKNSITKKIRKALLFPLSLI